MAGVGDKLMTASEIKEVTDTKMNKDFSNFDINPSALTNLESTSADNLLKASPRPGVTGTLPVANGGTGATTAAAARTNLDVYSKSETNTAIAQSMAITSYTGSNGLLIYRTGRLAQIAAFPNVTTTESNAVLGTITNNAYKPSSRIWMATKIYNGSAYTDCYIEITIAGVISVKSLTGATVSGYQGQYVQALGLTYICNGG